MLGHVTRSNRNRRLFPGKTVSILLLAMLLAAMFIPESSFSSPLAEVVPGSASTRAGAKQREVKKVLLMGDSFMQGYAPSFKAQLAKRGISTVGTGRQSTGLVIRNKYVWMDHFPELLDEHDPQLVICCMGANDTQGMRVGKRVLAFGKNEWKQEYGDRVKSLLVVAREAGARFAWVGLPRMRNRSYDRDVSVINEVVRKVMEENGGVFVSTYGVLPEFGEPRPDATGSGAAYRASDGIHCNDKGYRLVVQGIVRKLAELKVL